MKNRLVDILPSEEEAFDAFMDIGNNKDLDVSTWMKAFNWFVERTKEKQRNGKR